MRIVISLLFTVCFLHAFAGDKAIIVKSGVIDNKLSSEWRKAIESRMSRQRLDSFARLRRPLSAEEEQWINLITIKASKWGQFKDSLRVPFGSTYISDTTYVLLGYLGDDDGFTYLYNTVCLDVTALYRAYGAATLPENNNRIDRVFSHEYTHLLHKEWARQHQLQLCNFRDSVLWECLYEGIGMYRSLSSKWFPVNGSLPQISRQALAELAPVFKDRINKITSAASFTQDEKEQLHAGLSRGPVNKKWGALPVAIWLMLEAKGDDRNLVPWIEHGPEGVLALAKKYL